MHQKKFLGMLLDKKKLFMRFEENWLLYTEGAVI